MLAGYYGQEGQHAKAATVAEEMLQVVPDLSAKKAMELIPGLDRILSSEEYEQFPDNLRKAGLPE